MNFSHSPAPAIAVTELSYRYPGSAAPALRAVNLSLPAGTRVAVIGRNGCGKSTLFLHLNAILKPQVGQITVAGQPLSYDARALRQVRRQVGLVFQNPDDQLFSASVAQDIAFGPLALGLSVSEARRRVDEAAEMCQVTDLLERPAHALSVGQKARVALAGVMAMQPSILVADESLAMLDPWMQQQMIEIFDHLAQRGMTILLATHDLRLAQRWPDLVVVMEQGQVAACDSPAQVFADPILKSRIGLTEGLIAGVYL